MIDHISDINQIFYVSSIPDKAKIICTLILLIFTIGRHIISKPPN